MRGVLTYHSVDGSGSPISVSEAEFRAHVSWMRSGRVRVVSLGELLTLDPEVDALAITFDDGLASFAEIAAPLLIESGLPVTLFVVADHVGGTNHWDRHSSSIPQQSLIDWPGLRELAAQGVELGAHTRTHPDLTRLHRDGAAAEMLGSVERIRTETGVRPATFAYPYGAYDQGTVELARTHFDRAVTADLGVLPATGADPHRLPRLDAAYFRNPRRLSAWGSASFDAYLALRRAGRRAGRVLRARGGAR